MSWERSAFNVMIVSTYEFCNRLKPAIQTFSEKFYNDLVRVKLAENVQDILNSPQPKTEVDFVALVIDASLPKAVEKCKNDVSLIMPLFMTTRICIVNGSCRNCSLETAGELLAFADSFSIPYFNGHILDNLSCRVTAERILRFARYAVGYESGISGIIPIPKDFVDFTILRKP